MNRRWLNHSLLVLLAPAGIVARQDLLPREQEVTWGCGAAAVAPPGVHLPTAPAAGGAVAAWHLAVVIGAFLALAVIARLLLLVANALKSYLLPRRLSHHVLASSDAISMHAPRLARQFLLSLSLIRRGPPALV